MIKEKIYILHGWTYSIDKWKQFLKELEKDGYDPVMLKIPGLTAALEKAWTIEDYVDWLNKEFENQKNIILLGHSNGARIAIAFAAKYPEKVSKLIIIDSAGIYHNELPIRIKRVVFGSAARLGKKFSNAKVLRKLLYRFAREHDYEKADPVVKKTMVNLIQTDLSGEFSKIKIPTVIIWGGKDQVTPLSDGRVMSAEIKNSSLHIISGAKHSPQLTHPKDVAEIIKSVLSL